MYNHNKAQQSKNRVHISWDILYNPSYSYKKECCAGIENVFDACRNKKMATVFLVGDLNINIMKPCVSACLLDTMDICGLTNMIKKPTCFKSPEGTLLDVILTASPKRVASVLNVDTAISDFHNLIAFSKKLHVPRTARTPIWYRSYKKFDEECFKYDIVNAPYHVGEIFDDLDDKYWYSKYLIDDIINEHAPGGGCQYSTSVGKVCKKGGQKYTILKNIGVKILQVWKWGSKFYMLKNRGQNSTMLEKRGVNILHPTPKVEVKILHRLKKGGQKGRAYPLPKI